jgi:hypothetical protein
VPEVVLQVLLLFPLEAEDAVVAKFIELVELETEEFGWRSSESEGVIGDWRLGIETAGLARLGEGRTPEGLVMAGEGRDIPGEVIDIPINDIRYLLSNKILFFLNKLPGEVRLKGLDIPMSEDCSMSESPAFEFGDKGSPALPAEPRLSSWLCTLFALPTTFPLASSR